MKIKSLFHDILGSTRVVKARSDALKKASSTPDGKDNISYIAKQLHPGKITVELIDIKEYQGFKVFIVKTKKKIIPYFKSGQFLTIEINIENKVYTRPFYILSSPNESENTCTLKFVIFENSHDEIVKYLYLNTRSKDEFICEIGFGHLYYEPLRDKKNIVAISILKTIIPFLSLLKEIKNKKLDLNVIVYCFLNSDEIILIKNLIDDLDIDKEKIIFLTKPIDEFYIENIKDFNDSSFFLFLPLSLEKEMRKKLKEKNIKDRLIRSELFIDSTKSPNENDDESFKMTIIQGIEEYCFLINKGESIASCIERNGLRIHTSCRKGQCGLCRVKIISGKYYIPDEYDFRRMADKELGYVHACMTFPISDLTIKINIE